MQALKKNYVSNNYTYKVMQTGAPLKLCLLTGKVKSLTTTKSERIFI